MRKASGWVVAAVLAGTGCGGGGNQGVSQATVDEHKGPDVSCAQCFVTGGGQIFLGEQGVQFDIQAIPESGPAAGPGFGGTGVAAKGHVQFNAVPASGDGLALDANVDTILSCSREGGVLIAVVGGTIVGDGRFTAVVTDGGEPADDTIAFTDTTTIPTTSVANGNIQVHQLDQCEAPCPEGQCVCPDDHVTCEPCPPADPPATMPAPLPATLPQ